LGRPAGVVEVSDPLGCGRRVVDEDGNIICAETGRVLGVAIDVAPEWNAARDREKGVDRVRASVRSTYTYHTGSEQVGFDLGVGSRRRRLERILRRRRGGARSARVPFSYHERLAYEHLKTLKDAVSILALPREVHETAALIIQNYINARLSRGLKGERHASVEDVVAAAINQAVILHGYSLEQAKILEALGVKDLWRGTRELKKYGAFDDLWRKTYAQGKGRRARHIDMAKNFVTSAVGSLGLPMEVATLAMEIIDKIVEMGKSVEGRKPEALAGAAVYLAAHLLDYRVSQRDVARVLSIKESAIRKQFRFILSNLVILVKV
jgi:transcription initiation factor TFIIB